MTVIKSILITLFTIAVVVPVFIVGTIFVVGIIFAEQIIRCKNGLLKLGSKLCVVIALTWSANAAQWYVDSSRTGQSLNNGTSPVNAFTNWVPLGGLDGQWTSVAVGGDTIWIFPGVGYIGNRTGLPDAIVMYNVIGLTNNPIVFKAVQTNGLVKLPPIVTTGRFVLWDGRLSDTYTNLINFDNMANIFQITNNINLWIRGLYGFGTNTQNGIYMPNAGYGMRFTWIHIDPFTYNIGNYPFGNNPNGVGANTHGVNILQNTGEHLDGGEVGYCYIEEADQCCISMVNNNAPIWQGFHIHHNVMTKQGDAGMRLAGGMEVDHNLIGQPWTIHGHGNGLVQVPNLSLFHHNIVLNTLDTMMYTSGGDLNGIAPGIKIYNNLFYTTKDWSFIYTNQFSSNLPFVNHSIGGLQLLVEANANHVSPWLPQTYTNFVIANNTFIIGLGAVPTNANAGMSGAISMPNRDAPGTPDTLADAGFVYLTNMFAVNNLIYSVAPSNFGQILGGFAGWLDRFTADPTTWANPASNSVSGILFSQSNTNNPNPNTGSTNLLFDYNVTAADQGFPVNQFGYNGPNSTNNLYTASTFNTAYTTNGYIHNLGSVPSLVDTNNYDFHPRVFDSVLIGNGTNLSNFTNAPGGLPQYNIDLSGVVRPSRPAIGAYEPQTDLILHYTFDDLLPATGSVAIGISPFVTDITGYGGTLQYWGFTNAPATNWPVRIPFTNAIGPRYAYAAEFLSNSNAIPSYGNFTVARYGGITNIGVFSNLSAITISVWMKYYSSLGDTKDNSATIIDTCEGSPGNGVTWSLGRNSAYQTSFDLFTNLNYNTQLTLHLNFPDNESTDWHFYTATFNTTNKQMNIYLDGTNCGFRDFTGYSPYLTNLIVGVPSTGGSYGGQNGWIMIGGRTHVGSPNLADSDLFPNNAWMDGQVSDLRVYNRALAAGEVLSLYNNGGTAPSGPAPPPGPDPFIFAQPQPQTIPVNGFASFAVGATGNTPLSYQWSVNSIPVTGANQNIYSINNVPLSMNGSLFSVVVTDAAGSLTSSSALLTVTNPPVVQVTGLKLNLHGPVNIHGPFHAP